MKITKKVISEVMSKMGKKGDRDKKAAATRKRMAALTDDERRALASKAGRASAKARAKAKGAK